MTPQAVSRLMEPLRRRVQLMVGRAVLRAAGDAGLQVTLLAGETRDGVWHAQPYGLATAPLGGAEAVVLCVGGGRDHPIAVVVADPRHHPGSLAPGEVALHAATVGQRVLMRADGVVMIQAPDLVRIEAPEVEMTGNLTVAGSVTEGGGA